MRPAMNRKGRRAASRSRNPKKLVRPPLASAARSLIGDEVPAAQPDRQLQHPLASRHPIRHRAGHVHPWTTAGSVRRAPGRAGADADTQRSEEHTSELQSLMRISYAVFCLKKKKTKQKIIYINKIKLT